MRDSTGPARASLISSLDEKYLANSIVYDAMLASASLTLDADGLRTENGELDQAWIRRRIEASTWEASALRQRLTFAPLGISAPAWVPVERLDMDHHVRFHPDVVPAGGPAFMELITGRSGPPLPKDRPLWRILFIEEDTGAVTMVVSWHHVMGDAMYGINFMHILTDDEPTRDIPDVRDEDRRALGRPPRNSVGAVALVAGEWWATKNPGERWQAYWSRPFSRRLRRVAARWLRPARNSIIRMRHLAEQVPARHSRMIRFDLAQAAELGAGLGGSLNDLTVAAALIAVLDADAGLNEAALLVPISRRPKAGAVDQRNAVSSVRVHVRRGLELPEIMSSVREQMRAGMRSSSSEPAGRQNGYATMVRADTDYKYLGPAKITAVAGWPAGDPRDDVAVLACAYADTLTVAISTHSTTDIDALVASIAASFEARATTR